MRPLADHGRLRLVPHAPVVLPQRSVQRRAQGRVGQIHLEIPRPLESFPGLVHAGEPPGQERRFEVLQVTAHGLLGDLRMRGQILRTELLSGTVRHIGQQPVQFLHVLDAVQAGQVAQQHLVDHILAEKAPRMPPHPGTHRRFRVAAEVEIVGEVPVQRVHVERPVTGTARRIRLHDFVLQAAQAQVLGERQRRQQKIREAAGAGFLALPLQRRARGTRSDEAAGRILIGQDLEVNFPVLQVLDLVEDHHAAVAGAASSLLPIQMQQALQWLAVIDRRVQRRVENSVRRKPARDQLPHQLQQQHGLADAARAHQDHAAAHPPLPRQREQRREILARPRKIRNRVDARVRPPRIVLQQAPGNVFRIDVQQHGGKVREVDIAYIIP